MMHSSQLSYTYDGSTPISFPDISIKAGEHTLILGQSGCGKTTLLHLLAGLRKPTTGEITMIDHSITNMSSSEVDRFRGQNIGMIFQVPHFIRSLSVIENLSMARSLAGLKDDDQKCFELLKRLNLAGKEYKKPHQLSVGEQQRVAIIRSMINEPKIIFADEPTSALDDINTKQVVELLKKEADIHEATLVVVTHDQRLKDNFENKIEL